MYAMVNPQQRDEQFPWLRDLSDEQIWKIWLTYDRAYDHKGYAPWDWDRERPVTTHDQAIEVVGSLLAPTIMADQMEDLEDQLEFDEEYKLATWMRKLRHERETVDEERARHERDDRLAEELARLRRRRRPHN